MRGAQTISYEFLNPVLLRRANDQLWRPFLSFSRLLAGESLIPSQTSGAEHLQQVGLSTGFPTEFPFMLWCELGRVRDLRASCPAWTDKCSVAVLDCGPWIRSSLMLFSDLIAVIATVLHPNMLTCDSSSNC